MIFELWLAPQLKTTKFIPIFLLESPCIARDYSKTSGYYFSRHNLDRENLPTTNGHTANHILEYF